MHEDRQLNAAHYNGTFRIVQMTALQQLELRKPPVDKNYSYMAELPFHTRSTGKHL